MITTKQITVLSNDETLKSMFTFEGNILTIRQGETPTDKTDKILDVTDTIMLDITNIIELLVFMRDCINNEN